MKPKVEKARRVVVALRMAGIAGQDKLNGVFEYLSEGHRWQLSIYRTRHEFTAEAVRRELAEGAEGFIVGIPETDRALKVLASAAVPVVVANVTGGGIERRAANIAFVKSDSSAVGSAAAAELLREGAYSSYGYVGYGRDEDWSRGRGDAFCRALGQSGITASVYEKGGLAAWLGALPKPCGILAACDDRAFEILDLCCELGLRVPADVAVLGVNNDPILCENSEPRLSSIQPDFVKEGRIAARILDMMMAQRQPSGIDSERTVRVGVKRIVHRESTRPESESGRLVQKALAYIRNNALRGIGVADVAQSMRVSTVLLNLRFRELGHEPVYRTILDIRLNEVMRRLCSTRDSLDAIAADCGWENPNALKNLFKRRFGQSMRDYRNRQQMIDKA